MSRAQSSPTHGESRGGGEEKRREKKEERHASMRFLDRCADKYIFPRRVTRTRGKLSILSMLQLTDKQFIRDFGVLVFLE